MFVKVNLTSAPGHYVWLGEASVWLAYPDLKGCRLYLKHLMEASAQPSMIPKLDTDARVLLLHRIHLMEQCGSVVETTGSVTEACGFFKLMPLTARNMSGDVEVGVDPLMINAVSPAFDRQGELIGSNLYLRRMSLEMDGVILPARESVETILLRAGISCYRSGEMGESATEVDPELQPPAIIRPQ